jgi:hypothetical protein
MKSILLDSSIVSSDEDFKYACDDSEARLFVENLWNRYKDHADKDFPQKIATRFHDHFWEMYLACTLKDNGNDLLIKTRWKGPDIEIKSADFSRIWVEAIAATPGYGEDRVHLPKLDNEMIYVPQEQIVLRYTTAIDAKYKKYTYYKNENIIGISEPYIIAVNGNKVPCASDDENPYIVQALFPIGLQFVQINWDTPEESTTGYTYRPEIKKASGNCVPTNNFLRREYEGISGIIFSRVGIREFRGKMGGDFIFVHNPFALNKLPDGWFRMGHEYHLEGNSLKCKRWSR